MTDGPAAEVGEIMTVNFPRPRERKAVFEHPDYYKLREQLIEFLEVRAHRKPAATNNEFSPPPSNQFSPPPVPAVSAHSKAIEVLLSHSRIKPKCQP